MDGAALWRQRNKRQPPKIHTHFAFQIEGTNEPRIYVCFDILWNETAVQFQKTFMFPKL